MKQHANEIVLSAPDLVGHLNCGHLTELDLQFATGALAEPMRWETSSRRVEMALAQELVFRMRRVERLL